jgi:hypothetical protein
MNFPLRKHKSTISSGLFKTKQKSETQITGLLRYTSLSPPFYCVCSLRWKVQGPRPGAKIKIKIKINKSVVIKWRRWFLFGCVVCCRLNSILLLYWWRSLNIKMCCWTTSECTCPPVCPPFFYLGHCCCWFTSAINPVRVGYFHQIWRK